MRVQCLVFPCNPSTQETKAVMLKVQGHPGLQSETYSMKQTSMREGGEKERYNGDITHFQKARTVRIDFAGACMRVEVIRLLNS